jgi:hypothetical protein
MLAAGARSATLSHFEQFASPRRDYLQAAL